MWAGLTNARMRGHRELAVGLILGVPIPSGHDLGGMCDRPIS